ncbi:MAG: hypothetical protein LQ342_008265 [Letrouitia transgressa]|nr:MAG: hypothetical protein LQ342_008265 [Letrouitia transgressa]
MPITPRARAEGLAKGGNALGLEGAKNETLSVLYFGVTFNSAEGSERVLTDHQAFVKSMRALAEARGVLHRYIMLTYAGNGQLVMESYGPESVAKLKAVQSAYDPNFLFQTLVTGRQKLPVAGTYQSRAVDIA